MHTLISFFKEFKVPKKRELISAFSSFSQKQFFIFLGTVVVACVATILLVSRINSLFLVEIPADGGKIREGIIGIPSLVNPVLALSDADKDLTSIVYSGLMRKMPDGRFIPDLAESYDISADGTLYTFTLKKDIVFHDNTPVTVDDIIFTIEKIQDPLIKSPRKIAWDGITVEKVGESTVAFRLKKPYISFMNNTTTGILPSHLWKNVTPSEFGVFPLNIKAIGSGAFKITSVVRTKDGVPESYTLTRFNKFALGIPHIKEITFISYANENTLLKALLNGSIDQASGISPDEATAIEKAHSAIHTSTLPRTFGIFFNTQQNKIFTDTAVVKAFDKALDREDIINQVLYGYGKPINSPIPDSFIAGDTHTYNSSFSSIEEAESILQKAGWIRGDDGVRRKGGTKVVTQTKKVNGKTVTQKTTVKTPEAPMILSFSLTTGDTPELKETALLIKTQLEKIGAVVDIEKVYETGKLNQVIRARDYEALFFGQVVNNESDLFSFWHSSQRTDPGLNIALYSNQTIDGLLEKVLQTRDTKQRATLYQSMIREFQERTPALLLYSPTYIYATSKNLKNISIETLTIPSDRFASIHTWYANTDNVWKIFTK